MKTIFVITLSDLPYVTVNVEVLLLTSLIWLLLVVAEPPSVTVMLLVVPVMFLLDADKVTVESALACKQNNANTAVKRLHRYIFFIMICFNKLFVISSSIVLSLQN